MTQKMVMTVIAVAMATKKKMEMKVSPMAISAQRLWI
jgi:hypothetical protein